jgi:DnaK suppressor protein
VKQRREFLERTRQRLLDKKEYMSQQIEMLSREKVSDQQVKDTGDEALSLTMEKLQSSLQSSELDELKLIDQALNRIDRGEYGVCVDCGEQISAQRLEFYPYAARCIVCQEAMEG